MKKGLYTMLNTKQQEFVDYAVKKFGTNELTVSELKRVFGKSMANRLVSRVVLNKFIQEVA